ncbi:killer cell lectin-like receptor 2 [Arvicola amphibius]|uniref:killer cell lectin-like receptor 2 n=1 Tax=Arvicola amphibius TaxID=1047088 RepID=UPI0018E32CEF|nr:killer cell lectin-like receptor 2 [Arvicola amphibius]
MRNQQVIYSNSRVFESSSESQSPASQDETHGPREVCHKVALGILCLLLMTAIAVWLTYIFQCSQEKYDQNNLDQSTLQNTSASKKTLTNKAPENEGCKNQEEQKRCCGKTKAVLDYGKYTGKCAEAHLFCCGIKCYYFIMDNKHWSGCKQTCQDCSFSLLKIDDDDELMFLKYQLITNTFWIGLSYEISKSKWGWIDNGTSKLDLRKLRLLKENGTCACLSFRGIRESDCGTKRPCICEKRMDRFPDSVYSMKGK